MVNLTRDVSQTLSSYNTKNNIVTER